MHDLDQLKLDAASHSSKNSVKEVDLFAHLDVTAECGIRVVSAMVGIFNSVTVGVAPGRDRRCLPIVIQKFDR
jgi:hypothetical protein